MALFDNTAPSSQATTAAPTSAAFDVPNPLSSAQSATQTPAHPVYNKNDVNITIQTRRDATSVQAVARFTNNSTSTSISGLALQVAVPKSQKLQLQALQSDDLAPGANVTQNMRITGVNGPPPAKLRLRLKVIYTRQGGASVTDQADWSEPT